MEGEDFGCRFWGLGVTYRPVSVLVAEIFQAICAPPLSDPFGLLVADPYPYGPARSITETLCPKENRDEGTFKKIEPNLTTF